jgi:hypothetical protein
MGVREVGFFKELEHGDPGGASIHDQVRDSAHPKVSEIAAYLDAGVPIMGGSGVVRDVLSEGREIIRGFQILTDGEWVWPAELSHYVRRYHVALPDELLERMERNRYRVPQLTPDRVKAISRAWIFR